jgi:hypothetical protein
MARPLTNLEQNVAKLEAASADLREATREAHEAIQTLRLLKRDITRLLETDAPKLVETAINEKVRTGLEEYADTVNNAMRDAVAHVGRTFDELARLYVGDERNPDEYLPTLAERRRAKLKEGT